MPLKRLCPDILGYAPPKAKAKGSSSAAASPGKQLPRPKENPFKAVLDAVDGIARRLNR